MFCVIALMCGFLFLFLTIHFIRQPQNYVLTINLARRLQPWLLPYSSSRCLPVCRSHSLLRYSISYPSTGSTQDCSSIQEFWQQIASHRQTSARSQLRRKLQIRVRDLIGIHARHAWLKKKKKKCRLLIRLVHEISDTRPKTVLSLRLPDTWRTPEPNTLPKSSKVRTHTSVTTVPRSRLSTTLTRPVTTLSVTSFPPFRRKSPDLWNSTLPIRKNRKTRKRSRLMSTTTALRTAHVHN